MADPKRIDALLAQVLPAGGLYAVGGRVRDEIRSTLDGVTRPAKDLDYVALGVTLPELVGRLERIGSANVVGAAFAVVKATVDGTTVDVALPRRERSTGVGHRDFQVESGPGVPLADDLGRRDFRMNMLARNVVTGELVDPHRGEQDIRAGRIDVVGPGVFADDPLRMLRACQFAARFGYRVSPAASTAMRASAALVASVSPERVRDELVKLLAAAQPSIGFEVMRETGLLPYVLPELSEGIGVTQNLYHAYDVYGHSLATVDAAPRDDVDGRLAALFHDVAKPRCKTTEDGEALAHFYGHEVAGADMTRDILTRLRFPAETVDRVGRLVRHHMYAADPELQPKTLRRFIQRVGQDLLEAQFELRAADIAGSGLPKRDDANERYEARVRAILAEQPALSVRDLEVSGSDVVAALCSAGVLPAGSRGGPEVGAILRLLLDRVVDEPGANSRAGLLAALPGAVAALGENVSRETSPPESN